MAETSYTPQNWYWIVGGSTAQVFSSKAGDYVPVADATYAAWLAAGNVPTKIDTEANLGAVLSPYSLRPAHPGVLDAYKETQATQITLAVVAKLLFNHENRIRALEGQPQITAVQFKTAIKGMM